MRHVVLKSLPLIYLFTTAPFLIEAWAGHRNPFQSVYMPLFFGEPLLMALGIAAAVLLVRPPRIDAFGRHAAAALYSVGLLLVTSIFAQGAHLPFIVSASIAAGVAGGFAAFWRPSMRPAAA